MNAISGQLKELKKTEEKIKNQFNKQCEKIVRNIKKQIPSRKFLIGFGSRKCEDNEPEGVVFFSLKYPVRCYGKIFIYFTYQGKIFIQMSIDKNGSESKYGNSDMYVKNNKLSQYQINKIEKFLKS